MRFTTFPYRFRHHRVAIALLLFTLFVLAGPRSIQAQTAAEFKNAKELPLFPSFKNPLTLIDPATGPGVSCPDPAVMSEVIDKVNVWYLYCTGDPLNSNDKDASGNLKNHYIATWRSIDLIHWTYNGDVFPSDPSWIGVETNLWAPAVKYFNKQYYLYYVAPATTAGGPEIGVATSAHAGSPWTDLGRPVIGAEAAPCCSGSHRAVIDPDVITDDTGQRYISFGSFFGGIAIQKLSKDGFTPTRAARSRSPSTISSREAPSTITTAGITSSSPLPIAATGR